MSVINICGRRETRKCAVHLSFRKQRNGGQAVQMLSNRAIQIEDRSNLNRIIEKRSFRLFS